MTITLQQVLDELYPEEPNYPQAAKLGANALPHLEYLVKTADPMLASKAAYLASLIQDEKSVNVLEAAAKSQHAVVRIAAAAASKNLSTNESKNILSLLINDTDIEVHKLTTKYWNDLNFTNN